MEARDFGLRYLRLLEHKFMKAFELNQTSLLLLGPLA
jgi:hypothetical protein